MLDLHDRIWDTLIVAADLHLRPHAWVKYPELRGDAYVALTALVDKAISLSAPLLLLGDIFDSKRPDSESVSVFIREVQRLRASGFPTYFIQGNHDLATPPWSAVAAISLHGRTIRLGDTRIYGLDFTTTPELAFAQIPPEASILAAHQSWAEVQRVGHTDAHAGMLPATVKMVLTGDYHVTDTYSSTVRPDVLFVSPGSTCLQAINETPEKFCIVLRVDGLGDGKPQIGFVALPSRNVYRLSVANEAEFAAAMTSLPLVLAAASRPEQPVEIQKPILHIKYSEQIADAATRIAAAAKDDWFVYPAFLPTQHTEISMPVDDHPSAFESLTSGLELLQAVGTPLHTAAARLLRAADINVELELLRTDSYATAAA